jgi:SM-20-related protein
MSKMPRTELLGRLGLFLRPAFLTPAICAALHREMDAAPGAPATVTREADYFDETARLTTRRHVSPEVVDAIEGRLLALQPELEGHFGVRLAGCEKPQFLAYRTGDFFGPHKDSNAEEGAADYLRRRQISAVVFLNEEAAEPSEGCYCGGQLTFYGLLQDPRLERYGVPLPGESGMLVAFRSATTHEVRRVTAGLRRTVVCWFY